MSEKLFIIVKKSQQEDYFNTVTDNLMIKFISYLVILN